MHSLAKHLLVKIEWFGGDGVIKVSPAACSASVLFTDYVWEKQDTSWDPKYSGEQEFQILVTIFPSLG